MQGSYTLHSSKDTKAELLIDILRAILYTNTTLSFGRKHPVVQPFMGIFRQRSVDYKAWSTQMTK